MTDRIVIDSWDWHYRIAFDERLASGIRQQALRLGECVERDILQQKLDVFSSIVSISALCDSIEGSASRADELLEDRPWICGILVCRSAANHKRSTGCL